LLYPERGVIHVPQRFATDWISLDPAGRIFSGAPSKNASYPAYGVPVLAVADGKIAAVHDGVADNIPPEVTEQLGQADRAGNYVILDIGGAFAFYGHLRPGSIRLKVGQTVRAGQVIASLGNSGNSTGPHLHFHVTDGPSLASEGLPFVFDAYEDLGALSVALDDLEAGKATLIGTPNRKAHDLPLGGRVIRFKIQRQ
jgi:murein DD-endopeptidase MepM/ murein hydrolase activator NlpD